jgi:hypothetical protein
MLLGGNLPESLGGITKLKTIYLYQSSVSSSIPDSIGNFLSFQTLDLSSSQVKGIIPKSIWKLSMLVLLKLHQNSWEGVLTEAHFQNLTRLKFMGLSAKYSTKWTLVLDVKYDWLPPFTLRFIQLENMQIGPNFQVWLKAQNELIYLSLTNVGILEIIET